MPGALGMFSVTRITRADRFAADFCARRIAGGPPLAARSQQTARSAYAVSTDRKDPVLSPFFTGSKAPQLLVTSTPDLLLSATTCSPCSN